MDMTQEWLDYTWKEYLKSIGRKPDDLKQFQAKAKSTEEEMYFAYRDSFLMMWWAQNNKKYLGSTWSSDEACDGGGWPTYIYDRMWMKHLVLRSVRAKVYPSPKDAMLDYQLHDRYLKRGEWVAWLACRLFWEAPTFEHKQLTTFFSQKCLLPRNHKKSELQVSMF